MVVLKPKLPLHEIDLFLTQQDTLSALAVWVILEAMSFVLLPNFQLVPGDNKLVSWVLISGALGIGGALMIGFSSSFIKLCHDSIPRRGTNRSTYVAIAQFVSWIGLIGVGFPLLACALEFWTILSHGLLNA